MADLFKFIGRCGTGALRRGIGCPPIWVIVFNALELDNQLVVFIIADYGLIQHMVAVVVVQDLSDEFVIALMK